MHRAVSTIAALLSALSLSSSCDAQSLNLKASAGLNATVGLDDRTQAFINSLPEKIKDQILDLLKQGLPLIDKSVILYLNRVNEILDQQIDHIECAAIGTGVTLGADLKSSLPLIGTKPEPVEDLQKDVESTIHGFQKQTDPTSYANKYSDFLYRAAVARCQVNIEPSASQTVAQVQANIRPRWMLWYRLEGSCLNADGCYDFLYGQLKDKMASSDKRDVLAVNAQVTAEAVKKPTGPGFFGQYDPTDFELALQQLLDAKDAIELAEKARIASADDAWSQANQKLTPMLADLGNENSEVNWPTNVFIDYKNAMTRLPDLLTQITTINVAARTAAQLNSAAYQTKYDALKAQLQGNANAVYQLYDHAVGVANRAGPFGMNGHYPPHLTKTSLD
jgi:hypothetical protein